MLLELVRLRLGLIIWPHPQEISIVMVHLTLRMGGRANQLQPDDLIGMVEQAIPPLSLEVLTTTGIERSLWRRELSGRQISMVLLSAIVLGFAVTELWRKLSALWA
jgi:hypothetical protein